MEKNKSKGYGSYREKSRSPYEREHDNVITFTKIKPEMEAYFAMQIIERTALGQANTDGEDSAGRQKLKLMPPYEIVNRACEISKLAMEQFEENGWLYKLPEPKKIEEPKKEKVNR